MECRTKLYAQNATLHKEIVEIKSVLDGRKERESGKRKILKSVRLISAEEVVTGGGTDRSQAKKKTQSKRKRRRQEFEESRIESVLKMRNINRNRRKKWIVVVL